MLEQATAGVVDADPDERRSEELKALRKGLGYCCLGRDGCGKRRSPTIRLHGGERRSARTASRSRAHSHFRAPTAILLVGAGVSVALMTTKDIETFICAGALLVLGIGLWAFNWWLYGRHVDPRDEEPG